MKEASRLFLEKAGWGDATAKNMQSGFSPRLYTRLVRNGQTACLMECDLTQRVETQLPEAFVAIDRLLRRLEISAPEIYAEDAAQGLILLEDFGDDLFGDLIDKGAAPKPYYARGVNVLVQLHEAFRVEEGQALNLPVLTAAIYAEQMDHFMDYYWPWKKGSAPSAEEKDSLHALWLDLLKEPLAGPQSLVLRDFMNDNLMNLPGRKDWRDTGVLDFQNAGIGPACYDVMSLAECIRRDQSEDYLSYVVDLYAKQRHIKDHEALRRSVLILSAQHHCRVLGITGLRAEKRNLAPRMEKHLQSILQEEVLAPLKKWCEERHILL